MAKRMELQDLNIYYGDFLAVQGVDMVIEPRAVTAFIGPSGCGKSTVLRSLDRMLELTPGGGSRARSCWTAKTSTHPTSTRSASASRWAWSSNNRTRSPP